MSNRWTQSDAIGFSELVSTPLPFNQFANEWLTLQGFILTMPTRRDLILGVQLWVWHHVGEADANAGQAIFSAIIQWCMKNEHNPNPRIDDSPKKARAIADEIYGGHHFGRSYNYYQPRPPAKWNCSQAHDFELAPHLVDAFIHAREVIYEHQKESPLVNYLVNHFAKRLGVSAASIACAYDIKQ